MDYEQIDSYMQRNGLAKEPAFEYLHFLIENIPPREHTTILGLYFPEGEIRGQPFGYLPPSTIILPADASEDTLLHELGHRYGDFYYSNLSEEFAENFRKAREKGIHMERIMVMPKMCIGCPGSPNLCSCCAISIEVK